MIINESDLAAYEDDEGYDGCSSTNANNLSTFLPTISNQLQRRTFSAMEDDELLKHSVVTHQNVNEVSILSCGTHMEFVYKAQSVYTKSVTSRLIG